MNRLESGLRVRVITNQLVHFRRVGTITQLAEIEGCYVHLDDDDRPDAVVFFHPEELEAAPNSPMLFAHLVHVERAFVANR